LVCGWQAHIPTSNKFHQHPLKRETTKVLKTFVVFFLPCSSFLLTNQPCQNAQDKDSKHDAGEKEKAQQAKASANK
jgi:hypothetical protein